ncbi:unnamed protein product [Linum trigynum]|uniref:Uncharacterized protein n=1 Tax=Linum trigynum TaxID=586398 RepID=A0AAV2FSV7_9ROSI
MHADVASDDGDMRPTHNEDVPHVNISQDGEMDVHEGGTEQEDEANVDDVGDSLEEHHEVTLRRGSRERRRLRELLETYDTEFAGHATKNSRVQYPMSNQVSYHRFSPEHKAYLEAINKIEGPRSFLEAMKDPHGERP